jgi:hypothetical protein
MHTPSSKSKPTNVKTRTGAFVIWIEIDFNHVVQSHDSPHAIFARQIELFQSLARPVRVPGMQALTVTQTWEDE